MISWIIILVIAIVLFFILFKIVKSMIKTFLVLSFIFLIVMGIFTIFLLKEVNDLKEEFPDSQKLFVVEHQGNIVSATPASVMEFGEDNPPKGLPKDKLDEMNLDYNPKDLSSIIGHNFVVILIKSDMLYDALPDVIKMESEDSNGSDNSSTFAKEEFINIILSEKPSDIILKKAIESNGWEVSDEIKEEVRKQILRDGNEEDIRSQFVMIGFSLIIEEKGIPYLISQMKEDNFIIYPDFLIFGVIKKIPDFFISLAVKTADKK